MEGINELDPKSSVEVETAKKTPKVKTEIDIGPLIQKLESIVSKARNGSELLCCLSQIPAGNHWCNQSQSLNRLLSGLKELNKLPEQLQNITGSKIKTFPDKMDLLKKTMSTICDTPTENNLQLLKAKILKDNKVIDLTSSIDVEEATEKGM
jgi:hypothetical protein